ncbi:MAG TPA: exo-alpha-sialidase [Thermoanaerobaculia bacterium]|nr:exo-alpha-sialidase [Thermoanaerobaculia bacterium]
MSRSLRIAAAVILLFTASSTFAEEKRSGAARAAAIEKKRIIPGSALDRLIRENQPKGEFRALQAPDNLVVPTWLRVLWRKNHPETRVAAFSSAAHDPTGGYPLVLKEIWQWLLAHQDLKPGPPEPIGGARLRIASVAGDLRTSGAQTSPRSESNIRVNPRNPSLIVAASNNIQASGRQAQFTSSDGGASWTQSYLPLTTGDELHSDPTVEWTSDGTAWATTIGIDASQQLRLRAYKSTDGGNTWTFDSTFSDTQNATDKQMTWVDSSPISPHRDNMYAIWHNNRPVFMNRRTSGAWQTPVQVSGAETTGTGIGSDVRTNSAGDVFAFWPDTGSRHIFMVKSTNGGASYSTPLIIATTFGAFTIAIPGMNDRQILIYTTAGAYKTSTASHVFAAWADLSGETGCATPGDAPAGNTASACKTRIWFSRSSNDGATWSAPVMINNQSSKNDQFNPWMVVDETNGRVALVYYDTAGDAARKKTDIYYQSSTDFGSTWSAPVRVSTAQTDETANGSDANQYGDYNGLSGSSSVFFPSWTDRRNNASEEIWTAAITDPGGTGPDPSILPWGFDRIPQAPPYWATSDIWVDNDGDGIGNEPNEPAREEPNNKLFARITNRGSTSASNYRVTFKFKPYTTNGSAPAHLIGSVDETGTLAPGASKVYNINWDLTSAFLNAHFSPPFNTTDHFCVQVTIEAMPSGTLDDVNPTNNFAQNNFDNVPVRTRKVARAKFFLYNHLDRVAVAALETDAGQKGWQVQFAGINDPAHVQMGPKQWLETEAILTTAGAPPVERGHAVLIDIRQRLDGTVVGGLTMGLRPEEEFEPPTPTPPTPATPPTPPTPTSVGAAWYAGVSSGLNRPFGSMADLYDIGPIFAAQIEREYGTSLRAGMQAGVHAFDGRPFENLELVNLSFYTRVRAASGSVQPFLAGGLGTYHANGHWNAGAQLSAGLEVPVTGTVALTTAITAHHVNSSPVRLRWLDATIGFLFKLP